MTQSLNGTRDGITYDDNLDRDRLNVQQLRVYNVMVDGGWHSLYQISEITSDPVQSVSARLRDLRKPRFGGHIVERRRNDGGLFEYRLALSEA